MKKKTLLVIITLCLFLIGCSNQTVKIENINDLNNKKIGVYTGSEYDTIAKKNIKNAKVLYFNSYSDEISALKAKKIDGFLTDSPLGQEILKNNSGLKILEQSLTTDSYAFAINPKLNDLKTQIDKIIIEMKNDGTLKTLEEKWFSNDENAKKLTKYNSNNYTKTIKFATVSGSAPFAYMKNNEIVGYDIDTINYIGNKLGYKIDIIEMSFEGIIPALSSGKVDMAGCSIIVTEERKKAVLFTEPNFTGGIVVVVRND